MKKLFSKFAIILFVVNFLLIPFVPEASSAGATLYLSPGSGTYTVGKNFSVKMVVDSGGGVGINAAEGVVKYDPSLVTVANVTNSGSIFNLWTTEPTYSNTAGTITFGGGSPSSYVGNAGTIFTVTFSAKKAGTADVTISGGIVLAADGKGTNVFSGYGQGKYIIEEKKEEEVIERPRPTETTQQPKPDEPKGLLPPMPDIESESHPDPEVWSNNNEPEFSWKILSDLTSVSYSINEKPEADPGSNADGIIEQKKFEPVDDGEWYFHIKFQNRYGWGKAAHRKLLIDATPPDSFNVIVDNEGDETNPTPKFRFKTRDEMSGLSYFDVTIDNQVTKARVEEVSKGYYLPQPLAPGEHVISIAAVDVAGNIASSTVSYIVVPLKAPIITSIPKVMSKKEELVIRGTSFYPDVKVNLYISYNGKEAQVFEIEADNAGSWSYFQKQSLEKGNYEIWAKITDSRGAQSLDSSRHIMTVVSPSIIEAFGFWIIILLMLIIIGLAVYIFYIREKHMLEKRRIKRETEEMKRKLSKIFAALREEVDELIELSDKRPGLSESERRVKEKLQESLDISEEFIGKEVEDVEKEIKLPS